MARRKKKTPIWLSTIIALVGLGYGVYTQVLAPDDTQEPSTSQNDSAVKSSVAELSEIPAYNGEPAIQLNNNQPDFSAEELSLAQGAWTHFSDLDDFNRVGAADGMLAKELMPTEERESLHVNPTGWQQKFYDNQPLYNRCHLIAFQLSGENNNWKNLMTGTAKFNHPGMTKYEEIVADYIRSTNHHVRYRVVPYFKDTELVARGVQMEAQSIEDDQVSYNVFLYNVQAGVAINYQDGTSQAN